jgi:hypothetical protein
LESKSLQQLSRDLFTPEQVAALAEQAAIDGWERKILTSYLRGKTLTKIPDTRSPQLHYRHELEQITIQCMGYPQCANQAGASAAVIVPKACAMALSRA